MLKNRLKKLLKSAGETFAIDAWVGIFILKLQVMIIMNEALT
jgi:hypothetical protein